MKKNNVFKIFLLIITLPVIKIMYGFLKLFPIQENLILFDTWQSYSYDANVLVLYETLKKNYPEYELVYVYHKKNGVNPIIENKVSVTSIRYWIMRAQAKYLITSADFQPLLTKRKQQVYLQCFSATLIKKNLCDAPISEKIKKRVRKQAEKWDYLVSPSSYASKNLTSFLGYDGKVLEFGLPRNQLLHRYSTEQLKEYNEKYNINPLSEIVIVYVQNEGIQGENVKIQLDLDLLENTPGIRTFISSTKSEVTKMVKDKYKTISVVENMQELQEVYIASNLMVTDYSSAMFEYLVLEKPIVLYPYDLDKHIKENRLYMDYNLLPAEQISDTERLIEIANNLNAYKAVWSNELLALKKQMIEKTDANASELILKEVLKN